MTITFTWDEFVQAAIERLTEVHPQLRSSGKVKFMQEYNDTCDGECYTFPPSHCEFEVQTVLH